MDRMRTPKRLLIVDDDPSARDWLAAFSDRLGYDVTIASSGEEAMECFTRLRPDLVTLDVLLPGIDGIDTLKALRTVDPAVPILMLSGHGNTKTIVDAVRHGASDFLRKPFEPEELELAFHKALQGRGPEGMRVSASPTAPLLIAGKRMAAVRDVIDSVADTDITVLLRGESGTGKERVAQVLYAKSPRSERPFVKVNCAALPHELLESELFGYEKGAFTGAQKRKLGKFEMAHGGTIFLDEISEMHPSLQAKLLQVLQDGQFSRLGGQTDVRVDARVIAATNRDLESSVRNGTFRDDLFYRLNVVSIRIPPLRERTDEIVSLTDYFLGRYADEFGKDEPTPSSELRELFEQYAWPGNVRELENLVKRMVVLGSEQPVRQELTARSTTQMAKPTTRGPAAGELDRFLRGETDRVSLKRIGREAAQSAERRLIEKVLHRTRWNRREAAEILQISYKALLYKIKDAGLADRV